VAEAKKNNNEPQAAVDPNFSPDDPNTFSRKAGVDFPVVNFAVEGVPSGPSDRYNYSLAVKADSSISHYAYKIDSTPTCDKAGGYTVSDAKSPIAVGLDKAPIGPVYLCVISFHFPTRQWQDLGKALAFNWEKAVFKRAIGSYYFVVDPTCLTPIRINAQLTIEGDKGSYVWTRVPQTGCPTDTTVNTSLISLVQVTETSMQGAWQQGILSGWFIFNWTNANRTSFKGNWGFGEPGVKSEGAWNSTDQ
jgi:hypothetical protein